MALALLLDVPINDIHSCVPLTNIIPQLTGDIQNAMAKLGVSNVDIINDVVERILHCGGLHGSITLEHLHRFTRTECVFVCTSVTRRQRVYLSHTSHPHVRVVDAIAASCCIPGVFRPVQIDGEFMVDGNLLETIPTPFPIAETFHFVIADSAPISCDTLEVTSYLSSIISILTRTTEQESRLPSHRRVLLTDTSMMFDPFISHEMAHRIRLKGFMQMMSYVRMGSESALRCVIFVCVEAYIRLSISIDLTTSDDETPPLPAS